MSMPKVTLYQFQLCPFCHKVRAALELKKIPYEKVEVSPGNKKELPNLPADAPRKVPVIQIDDQILWDSTDILMSIDRLVPNTLQLNADHDETEKQKVIELEDWMDEHLIPALPTVIYATWADAFRAARITAAESNFSFWEAIKVKVFGSIIMRIIAKRILKRHNRTDGASWVEECLTYLEGELADKEFLVGSKVSLADAAFHGALCCVEDFPVFQKAMNRPKVKLWFERINSLRLTQES